VESKKIKNKLLFSDPDPDSAKSFGSDLILIHNSGTEPVPYLKEVVDTEVVLGAGLQEDGVQVSGQPLACLSCHLPLVLHKQI